MPEQVWMATVCGFPNPRVKAYPHGLEVSGRTQRDVVAAGREHLAAPVGPRDTAGDDPPSL